MSLCRNHANGRFKKMVPMAGSTGDFGQKRAYCDPSNMRQFAAFMNCLKMDCGKLKYEKSPQEKLRRFGYSVN